MQQYPNCTFVTFHDAYPYSSYAINLSKLPLWKFQKINSPLDVQKLFAAVKQYKVKALFANQEDNKLLQSLSQDLNLTLRP